MWQTSSAYAAFTQTGLDTFSLHTMPGPAMTTKAKLSHSSIQRVLLVNQGGHSPPLSFGNSSKKKRSQERTGSPVSMAFSWLWRGAVLSC